MSAPATCSTLQPRPADPARRDDADQPPPDDRIPERRRYDVVFYQPWISPLYADPERAPVGGAERQIDYVARALAARGFSVAIVADPLPGMPSTADGIDLILRPRRATAAIGRLGGALARWRALSRLDAAVLVKRVAGHDAALVALAAKLSRSRFVYSSAGVVDFDFGRLEGRVKRWLYEWGVRSADPIIVQSDEQAALCRRRFGRDPEVIKSIAEPVPARTGPATAFVWIGRLVSYKRPLEFVELARALPGIQFEMVAVLPGDRDRALHAEVLRADRELDNFRLVGPQGRGGMERILDAAVAVVNTAEFEGMPNAFLEAWSRGVPALALSHDPDGVIEREGLGAFAGGSQRALAEQAREMWRGREDQTYLARCRDYVAREHAPTEIARRWEAALRLRRPRPDSS